jgi:hypothetical protein
MLHGWQGDGRDRTVRGSIVGAHSSTTGHQERLKARDWLGSWEASDILTRERGTLTITCLVQGHQMYDYGEIQAAVPRDASTVMASRPFVSTWMAAPCDRTLEPL